MSSPASKIKITPLDELFKSTAESEIGNEAAVEVKLELLHTYHNHPFYVKDEELGELIESIKQRGVMTPGIVRERASGGFELIAGHRRKRASELAGKRTMPVVVKVLTDTEADLFMVDTNIHREKILPSERAFAYKIKAEALARQKREGKSTEIIGEIENMSGKTIQRYIRLTNLIPEILMAVDETKIAFMAGVYLSYLPLPIQQEIIQIPDYYSISVENAEIVKNYYKYTETMDKPLFQKILAGNYILDDSEYYRRLLQLAQLADFNSEYITQDDVKRVLQIRDDAVEYGITFLEKGVLFDSHKFIAWEKALNKVFPEIKEYQKQHEAAKKSAEHRDDVQAVSGEKLYRDKNIRAAVTEEVNRENSLNNTAENKSEVSAEIDELDKTSRAIQQKENNQQEKLSESQEKLSSTLPKMKNVEERKEFVLGFRNWPIWFQVPEANEICYRYNLPDGSAIAVREYNTYVEWMAHHSNENPEKMYKKLYLLHPGYHYLNDCETSMTIIIEHLKDLSKKLIRG